jgi:uncharacterized protein (TIGR00266 family)
MSDIIDYKIVGNDFQAVEIELDPGEGVRAEVGAMLYMEADIQMDTSTDGGMFSGFKRMIAGESFFITTFLNQGRFKRKVTFSAPYPGKILPIDLNQFGGQFYCQKDAYLCSANGIDVTVAFTKKIGAGLFGGEGFILQELRGMGLAFIHAGGTIIKKELAPREKLRIDTGCLVGFERGVEYDIQFVGGIKNALFGGEGLFLTTLTGPGIVYLQTLPFSRIADRIIQSARLNKGEVKRGGSLLSTLLSGD